MIIFIYSIATNYVYDRLLKADNRALQLEVVQEANEDDVLWFKTLNQTQQISLVIGKLFQLHLLINYFSSIFGVNPSAYIANAYIVRNISS